MGSTHLDTCRINYVPLAKTYLINSDQSLLRGDNGKTVREGFEKIFFGTVVIGTESKLGRKTKLSHPQGV